MTPMICVNLPAPKPRWSLYPYRPFLSIRPALDERPVLDDADVGDRRAGVGEHAVFDADDPCLRTDADLAVADRAPPHVAERRDDAAFLHIGAGLDAEVEDARRRRVRAILAAPDTRVWRSRQRGQRLGISAEHAGPAHHVAQTDDGGADDRSVDGGVHAELDREG